MQGWEFNEYHVRFDTFAAARRVKTTETNNQKGACMSDPTQGGATRAADRKDAPSVHDIDQNQTAEAIPAPEGPTAVIETQNAAALSPPAILRACAALVGGHSWQEGDLVGNSTEGT